jgi:N-acetylmuramoyl-L-alanine amidase
LGQHGEAVRDLQRRLGAAGVAPSNDAPGEFGESTTESVAAFQRLRGLHTSGVCDEHTWLALVEAGWRLGDRLLLLDAPQLRGDDISELQDALNRLGFDCGRPDGIFGPATARALGDFQRNSGLIVDGICGPRTIRMLHLLRRQTGTGPGVASIREALADAASFTALRIVVGQFGGLSSITRPLTRALRHGGATVMSTDEYEAGAQAAAANHFGANLYIGFEARPDKHSLISYYAVPTFVSLGGRGFATQVGAQWCTNELPTPDVRGMRLPVLRETRMPAVLCSLGPVRVVVDATDAITATIAAAVAAWSDVAPTPGPATDPATTASTRSSA